MGSIPTFASLWLRENHASCVKITHQRFGGREDHHGDLGKTAGAACPPQWHFLCFQLMLRNLIAAEPKQPIGLDRLP